jgi:hypothetical protein
VLVHARAINSSVDKGGVDGFSHGENLEVIGARLHLWSIVLNESTEEIKVSHKLAMPGHVLAKIDGIEAGSLVKAGRPHQVG